MFGRLSHDIVTQAFRFTTPPGSPKRQGECQQTVGREWRIPHHLSPDQRGTYKDRDDMESPYRFGKLERRMSEPTGPLKGLRVFDLTRVLAGPTCAQMLADLGADVIKIERPGAGDDTRGFAPPFMPGTKESAYFTGVNRNKRSVTLDIAQKEGQDIALRLIADCDILVENFKVDALAKYGLGYEQLHAKFPRLVYCSITGFGQTGPYAPRPGYDSLIQGMGGVMSLTGGTVASASWRRCGTAT